MIHRIVLNNGSILLVEEGKSELHIGTETQGFEKDFAASICTITNQGVLVMPNSGDECGHLADGLKDAVGIRARLEFLRQQLRTESISTLELVELQELAPHIDGGDVELLEAAGVPEFPDSE